MTWPATGRPPHRSPSPPAEPAAAPGRGSAKEDAVADADHAHLGDPAHRSARAEARARPVLTPASAGASRERRTIQAVVASPTAKSTAEAACQRPSSCNVYG